LEKGKDDNNNIVHEERTKENTKLEIHDRKREIMPDIQKQIKAET